MHGRVCLVVADYVGADERLACGDRVEPCIRWRRAGFVALRHSDRRGVRDAFADGAALLRDAAAVADGVLRGIQHIAKMPDLMQNSIN